jgi:hypothetical protein
VARGYTPFPIYDFKTGLNLARRPWLIPRDAFKTMKNAFIYRGHISKRLGFQEWTTPGVSGDPIMGIDVYYTSTGTQELVCMDTRRFYTYDAVGGTWDDEAGVDIFTGNDADFFWTENWQNVLYFVNNVDRLTSWDGAAIATPDIEFSPGGGGNELDTCLLIFAYKGRLVILRTTESGTVHPQRARWSKAGLATDFTNDGYVDAPTLDWIVGADFLGDDLLVFFERSIWSLKYTGSADLPFRWQKVIDTEGAYATFGVFNFSNEVIGFGPTAIIGTDGFDAYNIDSKIPDIALDIDQAGIGRVFSLVVEEDKQVWNLYPTIGATASDAVLVLNYEDDTWSIFDIALSVLGFYQEEDDPTWDSMGELTWDEVDWSWDSRVLQGGFPVNLGGGHNGVIYKLNQSTSDDGAAIEMDIESGDWNPFLENGKKCRLGWVDVLVDRDPASTITFEFYANKLATAVVTQDITLDDGSAEDTIWIRVYANVVGETVMMRMYQNAAGCSMTLHAIVPYFKEAGNIGR